MAPFIYILCAATSMACAALLPRGYRHNRFGLLFWSGLCFAGLTLSNVVLVIDLVFAPHVDLAVTRNLLTLGGLSVLIYSLVWETQ